MADPLVHPKLARAMASAGAAMCAGAQAMPAPWDVGLFVVGWCVAYAGGAQLQQPEWLKGRQVVELAAVPVLMALGGLAGAVSVWKPHLREVMGAVAVVCAVLAGKARQEAVVLPPGIKSLALALLCAGALQGCAHKAPAPDDDPEPCPAEIAALDAAGCREVSTNPDAASDEVLMRCGELVTAARACRKKAASGPPAHELMAEAPESIPAPAQPQGPPSTACRQLDDARLFWGVWAKVCSTLTGGAGAGALATTGDPQRVVGGAGIGLLACAVATSYLETELAMRHTTQCGR